MKRPVIGTLLLAVALLVAVGSSSDAVKVWIATTATVWANTHYGVDSGETQDG
jgi:hypothetical protein